MKIIYQNPPRSLWEEICQRPAIDDSCLEDLVQEVFNEVKDNGDKAIIKYTKKFDGVSISKIELNNFKSTQDDSISASLKKAIQRAYKNIYKFHKAQKTAQIRVNTDYGVECWQDKKPIQEVGIYIPGGSAPLFSTILMLAIPAKIAGCKKIILCTPPNKEGVIHPAILYTAKLCGVSSVITVGGIQAIAGLTLGTESIPKVSKIFGPGNQYVTKAKQYALNLGVAIDMPAGPSELLIVADQSANPIFIAADLLSQAEHGKDSQVVLVCPSTEIVDEVREQINKQTHKLERKDIIAAALQNSFAVCLEDEKDQVDFINAYAPEHYIINVQNESFFVENCANAGSVFIGDYTPESAGDYASGTNHTLPTNGYARQYSGVNLDAFQKAITFQKIHARGIRSLGPDIETMAEAEGLKAHKMAVTYRLEALKEEAFNEDEVSSIELQGKASFINIKPYQSARDDFSTESKVTFLDANENPFNSTSNRYPDPHHKKLKTLLADYLKTTPNQLLIGNGSDEILDLVIRGFCTPAVHSLQIVDPTYGMYEILAELNHIKVEKITLNNDFSFPSQLWDTSDEKVGLSIICNPNNPTSNKVELDELEKIIASTEHMILIDEAYIEFSSDKSAIALISKYSNLMICRTMSKAFGLAGVRIGSLISNPQTIGYLTKLKAPYNCSSLNQKAAIARLRQIEMVQNEVEQIIRQRGLLMNELIKLSSIKRVLTSETNFIMVEVDEPNELYHALIKHGFVVRNRSNLHLCKGMLRITVGTEHENKRLFETLQRL
ncbi:MAG: hypothetical protein CMC18_00325 [Flavobacteriaceae bacterium]|nr:hypothetical protein [Flavobacteriaceae bacterium]